MQRIKAQLERSSIDANDMPYLQFRLVFFHQDGQGSKKRISYISQIYQYSNNTES